MDERREKKARMPFVRVALIQCAVLLYSLSSTMSKIAADSADAPVRLMLFYGLEIALLGVYALVWQQILKRVPVSVAYANRATNILWSMVIAAAWFGEQVTWTNLLGAVLVLGGTLVVDSDGK